MEILTVVHDSWVPILHVILFLMSYFCRYSNTISFSEEDPSYAAFHDEEWGVPIHDDKYVMREFTYISFPICQSWSIYLPFFTCSKLFELLSLSVALAELTWPTILSKRNIFRYISISTLCYISLLIAIYFRNSIYVNIFLSVNLLQGSLLEFWSNIRF